MSISNGEALALYRAGGHVGHLHVSFTSLNDASLKSGSPTAEAAGASAHNASSDQSTVAYIGDLDSASTQISLPLNNENDILQISPGSSYVGFTDLSHVDIPGDPTTYYANGQRTFARLIPSDSVQAAATVRYMRTLGVRRLAVIADTADPAPPTSRRWSPPTRPPPASRSSRNGPSRPGPRPRSATTPASPPRSRRATLTRCC